jgi:F0F1-type ATP synthase assembly protein I
MHRTFMTPTDATGETGPAGERSKDRSAPARVPWDPGEPQPAVGPPVERRDDDQSKKGLGDAYRKLEPYMAASSTLVGSVAGFTALGYWLDRKMGHSVQWLLLVGAVVGMVIGFVGFFTKVMRTARKR